MLSQWRWRLLQIARRMWFRASMFSLLGIVTALLAFLVAPYVPDDVPAKIGAEAVDRILTIIASSMLAVTTFSLSTMVAAYGTATSNVTPRASRLLAQDTTSHNVLATFLGSFLFSLVGIVALSTGVYGEKGRLVLFVVTIAVIIVIVATMLRWIDYLSHFGRVGETTRQVEEAASEALVSRRERPYLGGNPLVDGVAEIPGATPIYPQQTGYIQHVDLPALQNTAKSIGVRANLMVLPGTFVEPSRVIIWLEGPADDSLIADLRECFTIGDVRSFDQDPRFGMSVLAEIASRALSPGINDPGTAIDVIGRAVRCLLLWSAPDKTSEPEYPMVSVPPVTVDELFDDVFTPIARDGAAIVEVQIRLQKAFAMLSRTGEPRFAAAARRHSGLALSRARKALTSSADLDAVQEAAIPAFSANG